LPTGERRVPCDHYKENLVKLFELGNANGAKLILIKEPVNLPYANDETARHAPIGQLQAVASLLSKKMTAEALRDARNIVAEYPADPNAYALLAKAQLAAGDKKDAAKSLARMQYVSNFAGGIVAKYQEIIDSVSKDNNAPVVDAATAFGEYKGPYLFNDPLSDSFHPNAAGHQLIARLTTNAVFQAIAALSFARWPD
jgi:hypothetical protein